MISVAKSQVLAAGASPLEVFIAVDALLVDPAVLEFAVFSGSTQVFPAATGTPPVFGRQSVDVAGVNHLHIGHYCAAFTMPSTATTGLGEIRWYCSWTLTRSRARHRDPDRHHEGRAITSDPGYCLIPDLREDC